MASRRRPDGQSRIATLFGLAPCGVLPATGVTVGAVRSYRTFSPLPAFALRPFGLRDYGGQALHAGPARRSLKAQRAESEGGRYVFCATGPSGCPARELPGALP